MDRFGRATGADDWIHCDPLRAARDSPWKTTVAQGYLLLSLAGCMGIDVQMILEKSRVPLNSLEVRYMFNNYSSDQLYKEHPEVIILTTILPDAINSQVGSFAKSIVEEINGKKIKTLQDVYDALIVTDEEREFVTVKCVGQSRPIVLETSRVEAAQKRIIEKYAVIKDHYLGESKPEAGGEKAKGEVEAPAEEAAPEPETGAKQPAAAAE